MQVKLVVDINTDLDDVIDNPHGNVQKLADVIKDMLLHTNVAVLKDHQLKVLDGNGNTFAVIDMHVT